METGHLNMEKEFKKIQETINRLYDLQTDHLEAFRKKSIPDLEKQSAERSNEMARLIKSVNEFVKMAENESGTTMEPMLLSLNNKISTLLDQNKALETKVHDFRNGIKINMKKIEKGKRVSGISRLSRLFSKD